MALFNGIHSSNVKTVGGMLEIIMSTMSHFLFKISEVYGFPEEQTRGFVH